jgi:RNA polymerase sigma factor (sigma-70 family)
MTTTSPIVKLIRRLVEDHCVKQLPDTELLRRFNSERDEAAFNSLVHRHGSMVLDVCRNVLGNESEAEDAFQATFLVLARKAGAIRKQASVGSWLYGVAYRTALKARADSLRRRLREASAAGRIPSQPANDLSWGEVAQIVHAELNRFAEGYRAPLVLCYLEGRTQDEAARLLGVSKATVRKRLERGRALLRLRLVRRGLGSMAVLVAAAWPAPAVSAPVTPLLASATVKAAKLIAAASPAAAAAIPPRVAALTQEVLNIMLLSKLKVIAGTILVGSLLIAAALMGGVSQLPGTALAAQRPEEKVRPRSKNTADVKPAGPRESMLLLARKGGFLALTSEGKERAELTGPKGTRPALQGRLSPDGSRAAYVVTAGPPRVPGGAPQPWLFQVVVHKLGAADPAVVVDLPAHQLLLTWAPDGKRLLLTKETLPNTFETVLLDPKTGTSEPFELPAGVRVLDCSRDGKTFLVVHRQEKENRLGLTVKGDKEVRDLTDLKGRNAFQAARLSPDGTRVLFTDADPEDKDAHKWGLSSKPFVLEVASRKRQPLAEFPTNAQALGVAWSPNGKRLAYTWKQLHPELLKKDTLRINDTAIATEAFLIVADADGKNTQTVTSAKTNKAINAIFGSVDWR